MQDKENHLGGSNDFLQAILVLHLRRIVCKFCIGLFCKINETKNVFDAKFY